VGNRGLAAPFRLPISLPIPLPLLSERGGDELGVRATSSNWHGARRFAAATLAGLALAAQLLIAVLPSVVAITHDDPFPGHACHMGSSWDDPSPMPSDKAPKHHATDCPLCFALHQLWSYVHAAGPAVVLPAAATKASPVAAPRLAVHHSPNGPQQPRAPPLPV
jgi:hypothetical protein